MKLHIEKEVIGGSCMGACVEFPNIIESAKTEKDLVEKVKSAVISHQINLEKESENKCKAGKNMSIVTFEMA